MALCTLRKPCLLLESWLILWGLRHFALRMSSVQVLHGQASWPVPERHCQPMCPPCLPPITYSTRRYNFSRNYQVALVGSQIGAAVCIIPAHARYINHHPHAAQWLYKCWSWWQSQADVPWVLWDKAEVSRVRNTFTQGLIKVFSSEGVHIVGISTIPQFKQKSVVSPIVHGGGEAWPEEWFMDQQHAHRMRQSVLQQLGYFPDALTKPRIGLLSRKKTRQILNAAEVMSALSLLAPVDIGFFENATFKEQVTFMYDHDIIVSPHGAQLTGLPFMPDCGGVLEIYPRFYWLPGFFGSLAQNCGLTHLNLYPSTGSPSLESRPGARSYRFRAWARAANICAHVEEVVSAVRRLLDKRVECLARTTAVPRR